MRIISFIRIFITEIKSIWSGRCPGQRQGQAVLIWSMVTLKKIACWGGGGLGGPSSSLTGVRAPRAPAPQHAQQQHFGLGAVPTALRLSTALFLVQCILRKSNVHGGGAGSPLMSQQAKQKNSNKDLHLVNATNSTGEMG